MQHKLVQLISKLLPVIEHHAHARLGCCVLKKTGDYLPKRVGGLFLTYADEGGGA